MNETQFYITALKFEVLHIFRMQIFKKLQFVFPGQLGFLTDSNI